MDTQQLYFQIAHDQHEENYRRGRGFDARASAVLFLSATLAGVAAIVLKDFSGPRPPSPATIAVLAAIALAAGGAMWCSRSALRPRGWIGIDFNVLSEHLQDLDVTHGAKGFPAHAGIDPACSGGCASRRRFPRTRGDHRSDRPILQEDQMGQVLTYSAIVKSEISH